MRHANDAKVYMTNKKVTPRKAVSYNTDMQYYKNVPLRLIVYTEQHFARLKAKRFTINNTNQNIWIPNTYLEPDGTIKNDINIDFIMYKSSRQLELAGVKFNG